MQKTIDGLLSQQLIKMLDNSRVKIKNDDYSIKVCVNNREKYILRFDDSIGYEGGIYGSGDKLKHLAIVFNIIVDPSAFDSPELVTAYPTDLIKFVEGELKKIIKNKIPGPLEIHVGSQELEHHYIIELVTLLNENPKDYGRIGIAIVNENGDVEIL